MAIFELTKTAILPVPQTTLAMQGVRERYDLQRVLRENIDSISPNLYVLAEEYGDWEDARRRIDLLCLDKEANLAVVELKRSEDGGHMELQAIRYAAMVSTMTFEQAVEAHAAYLKSIGRNEDAESRILQFLEWDEPQNHEFGQDTHIILVSGEFSKEVTTTVLWLYDRGLDIRCVRLRPYALGDRTLLDIQQVIPLPEAAEYQVQLRKKAAEQRESQESGADWTRYDITINGATSSRLYKRKLFYLAVRALIANGVTPEQMQDVFPEKKFLRVPGGCNADEFQAKVSQMKNSSGGTYDIRRYYAEEGELFHVNGATYALTNQWSKKRLPGLDELIARYPQAGISYRKSSIDLGE
jgi:hypothetical protein